MMNKIISNILKGVAAAFDLFPSQDDPRIQPLKIPTESDVGSLTRDWANIGGDFDRTHKKFTNLSGVNNE